MVLSSLIGVIFLLIAYLLGSIPSGYLAGRWLKDIDIREHGSKSTGATNVLRTLGKSAAIAVLTVDILKGSLAVALPQLLYHFNPQSVMPSQWQYWLIIMAGVAVIMGHSRSIFLNFTGGKSVATSIGVLLVMNPVVALGTIAVFGLILGLSRIVSLSSIAGAIAVNILMICLHQPLPYVLFAAFAGIYVIVRHRANIQRILAGTEPQIGQKLSQPETST
jgi:acyl phosphate:glycerol-3-phosphate acyltransferase